MKTHIFLKIASVITLIYCAGHTSGIPWTPALGQEEIKVVDAMKLNSFQAEGATRTYWDFYVGFGLIISAFMLFKGMILWQLGTLSKNASVALRPVIFLLMTSFVINAILSWKYFFALPAILAIVIALLLAFAIGFSFKKKATFIK